MQVRAGAATSPALHWALSEVAGDRLMLLQEPAQTGDPSPETGSLLRASQIFEETFHHFWSADGPASYEEPIAFATVLLAQAVAGKEAELHQIAVRMAGRVAVLPGISGVEVLTSEGDGAASHHLLWLAAGRNRAVRRQVYLALEPSSAVQGLAWSVDRFDLLACDG